MKKDYLFTSESVSEGHPDKVCDRISDMVVDTYLTAEPQARVACETMVTTGYAVVAGEISTDCYIEIPQVVRKTIKNIGYSNSEMGFDFETCRYFLLAKTYTPYSLRSRHSMKVHCWAL